MVGAVLFLQLDQIGLASGQVELEALQVAVGGELAQALDAAATLADARQFLLAGFGVVHQALGLHQLRAEVVQAGGFDVQPLVAGKNAALALEGRQPGLGLLQTLTQGGQLRVQPGAVAAGRIDAQFQVGLDVGVGKGIGQGGCEPRIRAAVGEVHHPAVGGRCQGQILAQDVRQPVADGALAVGGVLPQLACGCLFRQLELVDHLECHVLTLNDVELGGHVAWRHLHRQHLRLLVAKGDQQRGGGVVLVGQYQGDAQRRQHGGGEGTEQHVAARPQDLQKMLDVHVRPQNRRSRTTMMSPACSGWSKSASISLTVPSAAWRRMRMPRSVPRGEMLPPSASPCCTVM